MDFKEDELVRIYNQAIMPDSVDPVGKTHKIPSFPVIAEQELGHYCAGLEQILTLLQRKYNTLKRKSAEYSREREDLLREIKDLRWKVEHERGDLLNEIEALRWQVEYDKRLLLEIKTSKAWGLARFIHFMFGYMTVNREIVKESKVYLEEIAQSGDASQHRFAMMCYRILNGASQTAKKLSPPAVDTSVGSKESETTGEPLPYVSAYQDDETFVLPMADDIKVIAFYLPQFHTFPENDEWWGDGFTEWVNTRKARPRFPNHYQPREPHRDIGYYDLSDIETMKKQAALAKAHGIAAFCLYYYWFDGKKLMEKPVELLMAHPEVDFPFCLCWANENWTRTWDGQQNSVLIQQNYSDENDVNFIKDLKRYITDRRYLRCGGKPVILVYHAKILPNPNKTFATWRQWCREHGVGEIQIWSCRTFIKTNEFQKIVEVDREVEFPPHMVSTLEMFPPSKFHAYKEDGYYYNYQKIISDLKHGTTFADKSPYPYYRCAMLGWDNSCRRDTGYSVWQYFSLESYHYWLRNIIEYTRKNFLKKERFIFINAWNEWAEGTYLEPDECYGYASINTTTRALCDLLPTPEYEVLAPAKEIVRQPGKVLIHLHVFYTDLMEEFINYLRQIPFKFDCEITTDSRQKRGAINAALKRNSIPNCEHCHISVTRNIGRDVAPFFESCSDKIDNYDFIGHFHTKKSKTVNWGGEWRRYLLDQLLGSPENVSAIFSRFERDPHMGMFFPCPVPTMRDYMHWEDNHDRCVNLLRAMGLPSELPARPVFPVGQMFWAKTKAVAPIFREGIINQDKFEEEKDQISNTLAHAIERIWKYVVQGSGFTTLCAIVPPSANLTTVQPSERTRTKRLAIYIHYSADRHVSDADMYMLRALKTCADIVFVSNGELSGNSHKKVSHVVKRVIQRENVGYDFGAWREALMSTELEGYDELVLLNNSIIGPFYPFEKIFARMSSPSIDFWGMSEFPETNNPRREEAKFLPNGIIPRHIQSYFLVFRKNVFTSKAFKDFWDNVKNETTLNAVVANCETRLSGYLEKAGFKSDVYLRASGRLQDVDKITPEYNAIYCRPQDFIILGFPFLKKNICYYMTQPQINETIHLISRFYQYPVQNIQITARTR